MRLGLIVACLSYCVGIASADDKTDFLLRALNDARGEEAVRVTEALIRRAALDRPGFIGRENNLNANLYSQDPNLAASTSDLLSSIRTEEALSLVLKAWAPVMGARGNQTARYSAWAPEPLYYWFLRSISQFGSERSAKFLVAVAVERRNSAQIRGAALQQLVYSRYDRKRSLYDSSVIAAAKELMSSSDKKASSAAIQFLGDS